MREVEFLERSSHKVDTELLSSKVSKSPNMILQNWQIFQNQTPDTYLMAVMFYHILNIEMKPKF